MAYIDCHTCTTKIATPVQRLALIFLTNISRAAQSCGSEPSQFPSDAHTILKPGVLSYQLSQRGRFAQNSPVGSGRNVGP